MAIKLTGSRASDEICGRVSMLWRHRLTLAGLVMRHRIT